MSEKIQKEIVVLYHANCPDGFGGAYAAWKKFGDSAEYIPVSYGDPVIEGLEGHEVYLVDFCYETTDEIKNLIKITKRLVVLDHHESNKEFAESTLEHVYDVNHSGATIAWSYFHPDTPMPNLMRYLEDGDLYRFALPETRDVFSYLLVLPFEFAEWDQLAKDLDDDASRAEILKKAHADTEFLNALVVSSVDRAKKVRFEGYETYFATTHPNITIKSQVGYSLYEKLPPIALVVSAHPNGFGVSIRGNGSVDVSKIAAKYGGGGHHDSSGFFIPNNEVMPWTIVEENENLSN
jgi:oligoribonuclease NrnB/cAMP/cGMP phosphodiesterase (DHH superfamily)